ncbi:phosphodiester glycosidase family protein [Anaerorhabdus sp.]|uniref:phosphodiester glycosidase family protein n=1 Tax=Anaerorhabdus sp. TaxID=1872524 RepID=UPI002B2160ED|nr:phosphodiester glycosidase family protein [Anaerorhabdus sp.]MEA4876035.1 phosphodiester glycosidase family protein [Anaerorhabdus sp.]
MKSIINFLIKITAGHLYKSHRGSNALDLYDDTIIYAPFDCEVVKTYDNGGTNSVWFQSIEKVLTPLGRYYVTFRCAHMDTFRFNQLGIAMGKVFKRYQPCYYAGNSGTKDKHCHIEFGLGKMKGSGWLNTGYTAFNLPVKKIDTEFGSKPMYECVFLETGIKVITCDSYQDKYQWKWVGDEEVSEIVTRINLSDTEFEYRFSLDGNKYGTAYDKTTMNYFSDKTLESEGWEKYLVVNGSVFYSYGNATYAEGLEKSRGINNQPFDMTCVSKFNDTMACGFTYDGYLVFNKQSNIIRDIDKYYGALTGMFGIMKDGQLCEWGKEIESQRNNMYSNTSGRTVIAKDAVNNQAVFITIPGATGSTGVKGKDLYPILKKHGCTDGMCNDGGGSVFFIHNGKVVVSTTRAVKNAILVYRRKRMQPTPGKVIGTINIKSIGLNIRDKVMGNKVAFVSVGGECDLLGFIDGIQKDGYQWVIVLYNGKECFAQYDSKVYWILLK